jgi:hypothetical protein
LCVQGRAMELKIATETDQQSWNDVVERSPHSTLYHSWKWLKLMEKYSVIKIAGIQSGARLYPVMIMEKNDIVGIYPLFLFSLARLQFCYSPPSHTETMYLGPLIPDIDTTKQEKKQIFLVEMQQVMDRFMKKDLKSNYIQIKTSPGFEDCRSFRWGGYTIEPRFTYHIDLREGTEKIWKGFNRSLRYYIEKAKKEGIVVSEGDKEDAYYIYDLLKERKRLTSSKEFLGSAFDILSTNQIKIFIAKADSERLSGIITLIHKDTVSFWMGSPKYSYKGISPNELVLWESIRWACEQGYSTYEIVGADDYALFQFKRKFNGKIIPYYHMKWYSKILNVGAAVSSSIKKRNNNLFEV